MRRATVGITAVLALVGFSLPAVGQRAAEPVPTPSQTTRGAPEVRAPVTEKDGAALAAIADDYVHLVLAAGRHDPAFTDGFCGPRAWQAQAAQGQPVPLPELRARCRALLARLRSVAPSPRGAFLEKQLGAVEAWMLRLSGQPMGLREEARRLFDIDPAPLAREELEGARDKVDETLAGDRSVQFRVDGVRKGFRVPRDRLSAVMDAALALLRTRTADLVPLPAGEHLQVTYVTGKPWRARSFYVGDFTSRLEICTDRPLELADVLELSAREGYPGRHVFDVLREAELVRGKGWREYSVHPLCSPESVVAEGAAAIALDIVMDKAAQRAFVHDVLAPLAGLRTLGLDEYLDYREAAKPLDRADDVAVGMLLDEGRPDAEVEEYLVRVGLRSSAEAKGALQYYRTFRSYVFARSAGADLVADWIGKGPERSARFLTLLRSPEVPSALSLQR